MCPAPGKTTKTGIDPEVEAIRKITEALEAVPDERRSAVLSYVAGRFGVNSLIQVSQQPSLNQSQGGAGGGPPGSEKASGLSQSIEEFMDQKNPANHYQRVAALAYYLDKARNIREFDNDTLSGANDEAHGPNLGNIRQILADAQTKYGFLAPASDGRRRLTARGKKVVEALPDREAVKAVMKQIPFRKAGSGRGPKKGKKQAQ